MRSLYSFILFLFLGLYCYGTAQTDPDQRRTPLPYPFARGTLMKIDPSTQTIDVNTDSGPTHFLLTPTTYIFRGKQKITSDKLKLGELLKLNYTTNELGRATVRRIKVAP